MTSDLSLEQQICTHDFKLLSAYQQETLELARGVARSLERIADALETVVAMEYDD